MTGIFKIVEYVPDKQVIIKFCRLHDSKLIDEYSAIAIDFDKLDTYDCDFFIKSLVRIGTSIIENQEESEPIINKTETLDGNSKLNIENLVGKNIEFKFENYKQSLLKMRRIEL
jgi:hypothetical protein